MYQPDSNPATRVKEPNNADFPENCAVANVSEAFGKPLAWGWADTSCNNTLAAFICRRPGEGGGGPGQRAQALCQETACTSGIDAHQQLP
jgi:hypothetical protein